MSFSLHISELHERKRHGGHVHLLFGITLHLFFKSILVLKVTHLLHYTHFVFSNARLNFFGFSVVLDYIDVWFWMFGVT